MENRQIKNHYDLIEFWKKTFIKSIKTETGSNLRHFSKAVELSKQLSLGNDFDKVMIKYLIFIQSNPLDKNHYFKYFNSYIKGKKLKEKFFKHDLNILKEYYKSYDSKTDHEKERQASKFSMLAWERYVLFMMLKFNGVYDKIDNGLMLDLDDIFNVKTLESREYNPLTNVSKVLRGVLPTSLKLVEYDISRANPTFIDLELGIERKSDIYSRIGKIEFNRLINSHKESDGITISKLRSKLKPLYGDKVNEVITEKRFNEKSRMYKDLTLYEKEYIEKFINANELKEYVRLHDAVYVKRNEEIKTTVFGKVKFKKTPLEPPKVFNDKELFYSYDERKVVTSPVSYKKFFIQENFIRVTEQNNDKITIFKDTNNVVKPFNHNTDTVSFLTSQINEFDTTEIENKLAKDINIDIKNSFHLIRPKPLKFYRDNKNSFGLPFKNGFCRLNKDMSDIEIIPYKEVKGFFPEHQTQKREFKPNIKNDVQISEFERFLTMVSTGKDPLKESLTDLDQETVKSFFSMYGYLCYTYKHKSFNPSIIFSDDGADNSSRKGGRGKTLVAEAISQVQKTMFKGGKEFDGSYRHRFADLDESIKVYVIDDVPANFKFEDLYTNISGDISCEPKGKSAKTIVFKEAPKFLITTNWFVTYDKDAVSTNRRFMEFKFTDFFNSENTPPSVFKHNLFSDWNEKEWNDFYNFSFACVILYLEEGLKAPEYDKNIDNYKAYFFNESVEEEFKRIFSTVKEYKNGFTVNDFLAVYNDGLNTLRYEKYFHKNNTKKMIEAYIFFHNEDFKYIPNQKRWVES